jgi:hypothetical protein
MRTFAALFLIAIAVPAHGSGWHDYRLKIAPGFAVERFNSFQVCLSGLGRELLVCPEDPPAFGPLVSYVVTEDAIITRHYGAKSDDRNPEMWDADASRQFYFRVMRSSGNVAGPYSDAEWRALGLPDLGSQDWVEPANPNFWTPLLGDALFLLMAAYYSVWPLVLLGLLIAGVAVWLIRRRSRRLRAAV